MEDVIHKLLLKSRVTQTTDRSGREVPEATKLSDSSALRELNGTHPELWSQIDAFPRSSSLKREEGIVPSLLFVPRLIVRRRQLTVNGIEQENQWEFLLVPGVWDSRPFRNAKACPPHGRSFEQPCTRGHKECCQSGRIVDSQVELPGGRMRCAVRLWSVPAPHWAKTRDWPLLLHRSVVK